MESCIFCQITKSSAPAHKIWENENFFAFLDVNPVNPGHTLLIPKYHVEYVFDLDEPLYSELFVVAKELSKPIQTAMEANRIGIVIEGFGVAHLHVHLIPISEVNGLNSARAKRATTEELAQIAERIKANLRESKLGHDGNSANFNFHHRAASGRQNDRGT